MNKITTCVFDAYGTLFDVNAACRELSKEVGDKWNELSNLWRLRQLEYTWLRNSMKEYIDFWKITSDALDYAMETLNINNIKLREELLLLYLKLLLIHFVIIDCVVCFEDLKSKLKNQ